MPVIAYRDRESYSSDTPSTVRTEYRIRSANLTALDSADFGVLRQTFGSDWQYHAYHRPSRIVFRSECYDDGLFLVEQRRIYGFGSSSPETGDWHPLSVEPTLYDAYGAVDSFAGSSVGRVRTPNAVPLTDGFASYLALLSQVWIEYDDYQRLRIDRENEAEALRWRTAEAFNVWKRMLESPTSRPACDLWNRFAESLRSCPADLALLHADPAFMTLHGEATMGLRIPQRRTAIRQAVRRAEEVLGRKFT